MMILLFFDDVDVMYLDGTRWDGMGCDILGRHCGDIELDVLH